MTDVHFEPWPKIPRLKRDVTITEKIDGTNAAILVVERDGEPSPGCLFANDKVEVYAQSRTRMVTIDKDNFGFAAWVQSNAEGILDSLSEHGGYVGRHFGEWWGSGIQRRYGLDHKRFSLFNTDRYKGLNVGFDDETRLMRVPVLYRGPDMNGGLEGSLTWLRNFGSVAAPGFIDPEGVVVYHHAARSMFKVTLKGDEAPKGQQS